MRTPTGTLPDDLTDRQRQVLRLRVLEGKTVRETAEALDLAPSTVYQHEQYARAKARLRHGG